MSVVTSPLRLGNENADPNSSSECPGGRLQAYQPAVGAPILSHIIFADDLILIAKATVQNARVLKDIMASFCEQSRQCVNVQKSQIIFSPNVDRNIRGAILNLTANTDQNRSL